MIIQLHQVENYDYYALVQNLHLVIIMECIAILIEKQLCTLNNVMNTLHNNYLSNEVLVYM